jgi:hypothetical protein
MLISHAAQRAIVRWGPCGSPLIGSTAAAAQARIGLGELELGHDRIKPPNACRPATTTTKAAFANS